MNAELITPAESVRLCELERVIQKGKDTFVEVGTALSEIRDSRIYRATFKTFEDYCQDRWGFTKNYVNRIIQAADVVTNLVPMGTSIPTSERQARELAKAPKEKRAEAMEKAQEIAKEEGKPVAARHVEAAVLEVMPKEDPEPLIVDGTGDDDEDEPMKPARNIKIFPNDADRLWLMAKQELSKIRPNDKSRVSVLNKVIEYAQERIASNK